VYELVCSPAFTSSALNACVRAGGEGGDALCRTLERGSLGSLRRSEAVLSEALRLLRGSESEGQVSLCEQLLLHLLTRTSDEHQNARCAAALKRPHGLLGLIADLSHANPATDRAADSADGERSGSGEKAPFSESARCFMCIRLLLELHAQAPHAAVWGDDSLCASDIDAMVRWLRDASRTAALGQERPAARLLGVVRRRGGYERTESQQQMLKALTALKKRR